MINLRELLLNSFGQKYHVSEISKNRFRQQQKGAAVQLMILTSSGQ